MSALPAVANLQILSSKQTGAIRKDVLEVAEKDVQYMLRSIAANEVSNQVKMGNKPTNLIVDGKNNKPIDQATKSIQVFFIDSAMMAKAAQEVFAILQMKGRRVTGYTLSHAKYYKGVGKASDLQVIGAPGPTSIPGRQAAATDLYVSILLPHIRKWQWLTASGARGTRKTRDKQKRSGPIVSKSIYETVAAAAQRKYKQLRIKPVYLKVPNVNPGGKTIVDRVPAIKIYMRTKGRL